jgi:hypothetical protein
MSGRGGWIVFVLPIVAGGCSGSSATSDGPEAADAEGGEFGETPPDGSDVDVRPRDGADADAEEDVDVGPDEPDADGRRDRPDGEVDRRDGDVRPDVGPESTGDGGCDPLMCSIECLMSGLGSGTCVEDTCVCGGDVDGSTDGGIDIPLDIPFEIPGEGFEFSLDGIDIPFDGLPDFSLEGLEFELPDGMDLPPIPEGFDFSFDAIPEVKLDISGPCDHLTCFAACLEAGYRYGFCDDYGSCACY